MKLVKWTDDDGWKHQSLIRDDMDDNLAYQGLPQNPPDLTELDYEELFKTLNNLLIDRNLIKMKDIQGSNELRNAVEIAFFRPIFELYRNKLIGGTNE